MSEKIPVLSDKPSAGSGAWKGDAALAALVRYLAQRAAEKDYAACQAAHEPHSEHDEKNSPEQRP